MPIGGLAIGRDWAIEFYDPLQGGIVQFPLITGWSKQQNTNRIQSRGLDGLTRIIDVPDTWEGNITFDRTNGALERYFAAREAAYRRGENLPACSIVEIITEVDGSVSEYRYNGVSLTFSNAGDVRGGEKVEQTVGWIAGSMEQLI